MQLVDAGMLAFAGWHALKGRVEWPLTFQVPRMLRSTLRDAGDGGDAYVLCWNAERLRKRELWPDYRDRPEIWDEAGEEDFRLMLRVLSALGAVQYRADGWEADEVLAALLHRLEGDEELEATLAENRDQLLLNLDLVDLSREAVGAPPDPMLEDWGDLEAAREIGERTGIGWLTDDDLAEEYASLRTWGERTRERLGV